MRFWSRGYSALHFSCSAAMHAAIQRMLQTVARFHILIMQLCTVQCTGRWHWSTGRAYLPYKFGVRARKNPIAFVWGCFCASRWSIYHIAATYGNFMPMSCARERLVSSHRTLASIPRVFGASIRSSSAFKSHVLDVTDVCSAMVWRLNTTEQRGCEQ